MLYVLLMSSISFDNNVQFVQLPPSQPTTDRGKELIARPAITMDERSCARDQQDASGPSGMDGMSWSR